MAFNFKLPGTAVHAGHLPVIGRLPLVQQLLILGSVVLVLFVMGILTLWGNVRDAGHGAAYIGATGQLRVLSQQIARAVSPALRGDAAVLKEIGEERDRFNQLLDALMKGGAIGSVDVPVTTIQKLLGHAWLETTQTYVAANDQQVQADYYAASQKLEGWRTPVPAGGAA